MYGYLFYRAETDGVTEDLNVLTRWKFSTYNPVYRVKFRPNNKFVKSLQNQKQVKLQQKSMSFVTALLFYLQKCIFFINIGFRTLLKSVRFHFNIIEKNYIWKESKLDFFFLATCEDVGYYPLFINKWNFISYAKILL